MCWIITRFEWSSENRIKLLRLPDRMNGQTQPDRMVKQTQTIRRLLPTNYLSAFDQFVRLALKRLNVQAAKGTVSQCCTQDRKVTGSIPFGCSTGSGYPADYLAFSVLGSKMSKGVIKNRLERLFPRKWPNFGLRNATC